MMTSQHAGHSDEGADHQAKLDRNSGRHPDPSPEVAGADFGEVEGANGQTEGIWKAKRHSSECIQFEGFGLKQGIENKINLLNWLTKYETTAKDSEITLKTYESMRERLRPNFSAKKLMDKAPQIAAKH